MSANGYERLQSLADEAAGYLKALSHPLRLTICCKLRDGEMAVGDMERLLDVSQPRLSRELGKLRAMEFVTTRRQSKLVFYRLEDNPRVRELIDAVCAVMLGEDAPQNGSSGQPRFRPNRAGGYGVFPRTDL